MPSSRLILGSLADVAIPALGLKNVVAKVDTGAFSGALHCTDIRVERHGKQGTLFFTPLGEEQLATSTREFKEVIVRSASGHESVRYIVPITLEIDGRPYDTMIGLTDRNSMKREMLLGRRFLLEHDAMVDVSLTKDLDDEAEMIEE